MSKISVWEKIAAFLLYLESDCLNKCVVCS